MKTKKSLLVVPAIALVFALVFTTCSNGGGGGGGRQDNSSGSVKFNMTGAKAILATGSGSGNSRAVYGAGNNLLKLLDNDKVVSILSGNQDMPNVRKIYRSSDEGRKDIYIQFWDDWSYVTEDGKSVSIANFIHVKEDGTVVNITSFDNSTHNPIEDIIAFDQKGNLYFFHSENFDGGYSVLYKYDPVTGKKEQITRLGNLDSFDLSISSSGDYVVVKVTNETYNDFGNGNIPFYSYSLRLIPTANPDMAYDLLSSEETSDFSGSFAFFALHHQKREIYISATFPYNDVINGVWKQNIKGVYKLSLIPGGDFRKKEDWQLTTLLEDSEEYYTLYSAPDGSIWGIAWKLQEPTTKFVRLVNSDGKPDYYILSIDNPSSRRSFLHMSQSHMYIAGGNGRYLSGVGQTLQNCIYRFRYDNPSSVENLFDRVTRNVDYINYFSIVGNFIYFNATDDWSNPILIDRTYNGKINLTTHEYSEVDWREYGEVTAIVAY
jgi:hypothetical protein